MKSGETMRIDQLNCLQVLYNNKSLSKSAEELYLNQPTLSRLLQAIEKELGTALFIRNHQGIAPNTLCKKIMPSIENILTEYAKMQEIIAVEKSKDAAGTIKLSATSMLCNNILLDLSTEFSDAYPLINIEISENYSLDVIEHIQQRKSDFGFLTVQISDKKDMLKKAELYGLKYEFLCQTPTVALISANSSLASNDIITPQDIKAMPMYMLKQMKFIINDNLPEQQNIHYCLDRDSRNKMIIKKDGYTILSPLEMTGDFYINQGLLMMKPFVEPANDISMELYVLYDRKHNQASYKEDFLDLVKKYFKNLNYPFAANV